jgi:hypothetical protein
MSFLSGSPKKNNRKTFELEDLNEDQKEISQYILQAIRDWIHCSRENIMRNFKPIHLTVPRVAGSGKSTLIYTQSTWSRDCSVVILLCGINGPTGCCAFSVGGKTVLSA